MCRRSASWLTTFRAWAAPFAATAPGKGARANRHARDRRVAAGQFPDLSVRIESIVADEDMVAYGSGRQAPTPAGSKSSCLRVASGSPVRQLRSAAPYWLRDRRARKR
jgi:hypothetical protein